MNSSTIKTLEESYASVRGPAKDPLSDINAEDKVAPTGKKFQLRAEEPRLPAQGEPAFRQFAADDLSAGNHAYTINRKERGLLGFFRNREYIDPVPLKIELDPALYYTAIYETLLSYFENLLVKKSSLKNEEIAARAKYEASIIADGVVVMTYLKFRSITVSEFQPDYKANNLKRPRVGSDLVIPLPYAFAIQQLGIVHIADIEREIKVAPVFPDEGHTYGLPTPRVWNPNTYYDSVVYAKSLGMQFGIVDLKEKKGTAWWLLRPYVSDNFFELRCVLPETNYTSTLALVYALFLPKDPNEKAVRLFDTTALGSQSFGTMMRKPHPGINLTAFEAITGTEQDVWTHV